MTEKYKRVGLQEDFWIDKLADKVSKSKIARAILGLTAVGTASQMAACTPPPPAEVAPISEASLSGVIGRDLLDKLSGNSKIIVENNLNFIANEYVDDENFVPGTEMIYAVGKGTDSFAWLLAGLKKENGSVGLKVTHYCNSFIRDNEDCQEIGEDLVLVEGGGNRLYGWVDENNEQHRVLLIDEDNNPTAFDINGSSYVEKTANSQSFVEKIVSIGALSVQAAAPEATATPQASETLPVVETATATAEPTATETVTATPSVEVDELGIRKEFARGEVMTKEEIKANVDWFYNLSDDELNKIVEGSLFSSDEYPNDSRPRDIDGNVLSNKEDLGWFYTKSRSLSGGLVFNSNYFNSIYLGTTYVESGGLEYNVTAYGSKDGHSNRIIIYGVNGIKDFGVDYFTLDESIKDRVISRSSGKFVSERSAIQNLLNNYMRNVVMIDAWYVFKSGSTNEEGALLDEIIGGKFLIDSLVDQRVNGNEYNSVFDGKTLSDSYDKDSIKDFVFVNMTAVFRDK